MLYNAPRGETQLLRGISPLPPKLSLVFGDARVPAFESHMGGVIVLTEELPAILALLQFG